MVSVLHNFRVCFAAVTHFLIWPRDPKRLVYRHVIYFYKPELFVGNPNAKTYFCQRVCSVRVSSAEWDERSQQKIRAKLTEGKNENKKKKCNFSLYLSGTDVKFQTNMEMKRKFCDLSFQGLTLEPRIGPIVLQKTFKCLIKGENGLGVGKCTLQINGDACFLSSRQDKLAVSGSRHCWHFFLFRELFSYLQHSRVISPPHPLRLTCLSSQSLPSALLYVSRAAGKVDR